MNTELIGNNLRFLREAGGYSLKELSGDIGFSVSSISEHEAGKHLQKMEIIKTYARFYDISIEQLTEEDLTQTICVDYHFRNYPELVEYLEYCLPSAWSDTAAENEDFREAWRSMETIMDLMKEGRNCGNYLPDKGFLLFAKTALETTSVEAAINALKLYSMKCYSVSNTDMEKAAEKATHLHAGDSVMKLIRKVMVLEDEEVEQERTQQVEKYEFVVSELIRIAKESDEWKDLAMYYEAMLRFLGLYNFGLLPSTARGAGLVKLCELAEQRNAYMERMLSHIYYNEDFLVTNKDTLELAIDYMKGGQA